MKLAVAITAILFFLSLSLNVSNAQSVFYVKPTPDSKCPANPCLTLSQYAVNGSTYFNSNTTFLFLPGNHTLDVNIFIFNVSNISFLSQREEPFETYSWITCTRPVFFNFTSLKAIKITGLTFRSCGTGIHLQRALYFNFVSHFVIEHSTFDYSNGSSLLIVSSSGTLKSVNFSTNFAEQYGGAVLSLSSSLVFLGDISFTYNKAGDRGGSIYSEDSTITFQNNVIFMNNTVVTYSNDAFGGAIGTLNTSVLFHGEATFFNNFAFQGGGITLAHLSLLHSTKSITFLQNSASAGGALYVVDESTVKLAGNSTFTRNFAIGMGSIIAARNSQLSFNGTNTFNENNLSHGFGGVTVISSVLHIDGDTVFSNNSVSMFGGALFIFFSNVTVTGSIGFINNSAGVFAGAMMVLFSSCQYNGLVVFESNVAPQAGAVNVQSGGYLSFTGVTVFHNNLCTTSEGAGAISAYVGHVVFNGTTVFDSNASPFGGGGAVVAFFATVIATGHVNVTNNSATNGGAIYLHRGDLSFNGTGLFLNNKCSGTGGALYSVSGSTVHFSGTFTFQGNYALEGGAISTEQASILSLESPLNLVFTDNRAQYGGAIFVLDRLTLNYCTQQNLLQYGSCFFEVFGMYTASATWSIDVHMFFRDNVADIAGSVLYGGLLQNCTIVFGNTPTVQSQNETALEFFHQISNITEHAITPVISSDPVSICFCQNNTYNSCDFDSPAIFRSPGQSFNFSIVAVDQSTNPVPATIRATFSVDSPSDLGSGERMQAVGPYCSRVRYKVFSSNHSVTMTLAAQSQCNELGTTLRTLNVILLPCPDGFQLSGERCVCENKLKKLSATCDVDSLTITKFRNIWVGALYSRNGSYEGLIIHDHCPFDYCKPDPVNFTLSNPSTQCSFNRRGILCGKCDYNRSVLLGSSRCEKCSNYYLFLLLVFAALGLALILFISIFRLTVAEGAINGLVFYANVVATNTTIFFPANSTNVLTVFIAWVNLDFGIKTCFFNGLDAYIKSWLQYAFPFYLWLLMALMILASRYSLKVTKLLGRNPVAVLATLFLLSYAKILRAVITALYATFLEYPDGSRETVWLIDGNIKYLHGKHIPLFVFSLVILVFLFVPYTLFLFVGQWLQAKSENRILRWMNASIVKYFLEAYYGPFKSVHRYWTGGLLLLRCALFLVFAFNIRGDTSVNLLVIASSMFGLAFLTRLTQGIYASWLLEFVEATYFLNLGILAAGTYHINQYGGNQVVLSYLSVAIAFTTFIAIAAIQLFNQVKQTKFYINCVAKHHLRVQNEAGERNDHDPPFIDSGDIPIRAQNTSEANVTLRDPLNILEN